MESVAEQRWQKTESVNLKIFFFYSKQQEIKRIQAQRPEGQHPNA